jgi:hypothetical protein
MAIKRNAPVYFRARRSGDQLEFNFLLIATALAVRSATHPIRAQMGVKRGSVTPAETPGQSLLTSDVGRDYCCSGGVFVGS